MPLGAWTLPLSLCPPQEYGFVHDSKAPIEFYIQEYHLDMLPLDRDVITLDIPTAYKVSREDGV